jgi:hypothetical protein
VNNRFDEIKKKHWKKFSKSMEGTFVKNRGKCGKY